MGGAAPSPPLRQAMLPRDWSAAVCCLAGFACQGMFALAGLGGIGLGRLAALARLLRRLASVGDRRPGLRRLVGSIFRAGSALLGAALRRGGLAFVLLVHVMLLFGRRWLDRGRRRELRAGGDSASTDAIMGQAEGLFCAGGPQRGFFARAAGPGSSLDVLGQSGRHSRMGDMDIPDGCPLELLAPLLADARRVGHRMVAGYGAPRSLGTPCWGRRAGPMGAPPVRLRRGLPRRR